MKKTQKVGKRMSMVRSYIVLYALNACQTNMCYLDGGCSRQMIGESQ